MVFQLGASHSFEDLQHVGIAIKQTEAGQNHIGLLYRQKDGAIHFCHLAWHCDLRNEVAKPSYHWDKMVALNDVNGRIFAGRIANLVKSNPQIPYSITYKGAPFHSDGTYNPLLPSGEGLTCATFILAFFESLLFPILNQETWQVRPEDKEWQAFVIKQLEFYSSPNQTEKPTPDHITAAQEFVGAMRFRPEEVAVCATHEKPPLDFEQALPLAAELNALLAN